MIRNELLIHIATWMNLKNMLSEKCQSQISTPWMIIFVCNYRKDKTNLQWQKDTSVDTWVVWRLNYKRTYKFWVDTSILYFDCGSGVYLAILIGLLCLKHVLLHSIIHQNFYFCIQNKLNQFMSIKCKVQEKNDKEYRTSFQ